MCFYFVVTNIYEPAYQKTDGYNRFCLVRSEFRNQLDCITLFKRGSVLGDVITKAWLVRIMATVKSSERRPILFIIRIIILM